MSKKLLLFIVIIVCLASVAWICLNKSAPPTQNAPVGQGAQATDAAGKVALTRPVHGVPILMYHSIGDEKGNDAVIDKQLFAEQMQFLHQQGFHPVSLNELCSYLEGNSGLPPKPVVITFDDGYRDLYEVAFPILRQYGFKSTAFIPATVAGARLTWEELKEMRAAGMEIGSHSLNHRDLGEMTPAEQAVEITRSKEMLDHNLQQDTRFFCYPNGSYNQETLRILKNSGFTIAVTLEPGWVKPGDDLLTLRRVWIGNGVDRKNFEERVTRPDYSFL